jgi:hypothetical protein
MPFSALTNTDVAIADGLDITHRSGQSEELAASAQMDMRHDGICLLLDRTYSSGHGCAGDASFST